MTIKNEVIYTSNKLPLFIAQCDDYIKRIRIFQASPNRTIADIAEEMFKVIRKLVNSSSFS